MQFRKKKEDPFIQGIEKIYKQFVAVLEDLGLSQWSALGNQFDPNFIMQ